MENDQYNTTWQEPAFTFKGTQSKEDFLNSSQIGIKELSHEDRLWVVDMLRNFVTTEIEKEYKEIQERMNYLKHLHQ